MRMPLALVLVFLSLAVFFPGNGFCGEEVLYGFEKGDEGWGIPDWAYEMASYVCRHAAVSNDVASEGASSLKLEVDFPGKGWGAAIVEGEAPFDWTKYSTLSCDAYIPEGAPPKIFCRPIVKVGNEWKWTEMARPLALKPGEWITVSANLKPGSRDWKRVEMVEKVESDGKIHGKVRKEIVIDITDEFRADIKAIDVRFESDRKEYKGPVYLDNIRVAE
ncbi:MAG: hypothetical protein V1927_01275 [Candidatus Omnitrophota bacterium]